MEAQVSWAPLHLVVLLCFFTALPHCRRFLSAEAAPTLVDSLPGFDGALPFRLETGYVTVDEENGAELFYYFIESEGDPRRDPVIVWLMRTLCPLKFIIEPYNNNGTVPRLRYHPYSWTKAASVLFVDSPVGAGFSFSQDPKGYDVGEVSNSLQLKTFLTKWFTEHPNYLSNPFYVGGESVGGKAVPFIAQKVHYCRGSSKMNSLISDIEAGLSPVINLKGYLVGNPATGESIEEESRVPFLHGMGIISDQLYEFHVHVLACDLSEDNQGASTAKREIYSTPRMGFALKHWTITTNFLMRFPENTFLYKKCMFISPRPNDQTTERKILQEETGVLKRPPPRPPMDCQTYGNYLSYFWANNNITREILGIKKDEWVRCHDGDLPYSWDIKSSIKYHNDMTTKGYRVLVYSGDHDSVIPFLGTHSWVRLRSLKIPIVDEWRAWHLDGQSAGFTIAYKNNLTFATIKGGGHTAPEYQPERCFAMFSRWISGEPL